MVSAGENLNQVCKIHIHWFAKYILIGLPKILNEVLMFRFHATALIGQPSVGSGDALIG